MAGPVVTSPRGGVVAAAVAAEAAELVERTTSRAPIKIARIARYAFLVRTRTRIGAPACTAAPSSTSLNPVTSSRSSSRRTRPPSAAWTSPTRRSSPPIRIFPRRARARARALKTETTLRARPMTRAYTSLGQAGVAGSGSVLGRFPSLLRCRGVMRANLRPIGVPGVLCYELDRPHHYVLRLVTH